MTDRRDPMPEGARHRLEQDRRSSRGQFWYLVPVVLFIAWAVYVLLVRLGLG